MEDQYAGGSPKADHLIVLVHGFWGKPKHVANIAKALRNGHSPDDLYILFASRNAGDLTYDGIELGGERVCAEIEETLAKVEESGGKITKLSVVGYSQGGLVSRYTVGLLYAKGILDKVDCMNYATFASPHLGIRSPLKGLGGKFWNSVGARTLGSSGRQMFGADKFRDTGRPLLSVLADPDSIFMSGLRKFRRHSLYSNIINDRTTAYYTTSIRRTDPFAGQLDELDINFLPGYNDILLDPENPIDFSSRKQLTTADKTSKWISNVRPILFFTAIIPVGIVYYFVNSFVKTRSSASRVKLYELGQGGVAIEQYRKSPLFLRKLRSEAEQAYNELGSARGQDHLSSASASSSEDEEQVEEEKNSGLQKKGAKMSDKRLMGLERKMSSPQEPTLALAPMQFEMIRSLDTIPWRKWPVWLHHDNHSHAGIVVRWDKPSFDEGLVVLKHFAEEELLTQ